MTHRLQEFRVFREKMNERILSRKHLGINRFFTLDTKAYEDGALDAKTKEIAGLAASMVLRCDDCIVPSAGGPGTTNAKGTMETEKNDSSFTRISCFSRENERTHSFAEALGNQSLFHA